MSTRSNICRLDKETRTIEAIYCHCDGYPEWIGDMLVQYYNNPEIVKELIGLGGLSSLHERIKPNPGEKHSFEERANGVTVAYTRDRGESWDWNKPSIYSYKKFLEFLQDSDDIEYIYLYVDEQIGWVFWNTSETYKTPVNKISQLAKNVENYLKEA